MSATLDIVPLRSLVAVVDYGGFQRAADALHLSQGAVSQHVRRLEATIGQPLLHRDNRGVRLTGSGETVVAAARRMLAIHDEILWDFTAGARQKLTIGASEHAADALLATLGSLETASFPEYQLHLRFDRGAQLRTALDNGALDLALLLGPATDNERACEVGALSLSWYSAPGWVPGPGARVSLVAIDEPCALRRRALDALAEHGKLAEVVCEAAHLAGLKAAVGAGLGTSLLAQAAQPQDGLVQRTDLPATAPVPLSLWARPGLPSALLGRAADALPKLLANA